MPERSLSPQRLAYLRAQKRRRRVVLVLQVLLLAAFLLCPSWATLIVVCGISAAAAYELLGFGDARFYNYDIDTGKAGDFVGYSLARKRYPHNGKTRTLVALMLRGALRLQSDGTMDLKNALGLCGTVYLTVPPRRQGTGKITLVLQGQLGEFEALTDEAEPLKTGQSVQVVGLSGPVMVVCRK